MTSIDAYWSDLVTVALLGTDRRDPPAPPDGQLANLAADHWQPTSADRMVQQVAACAAIRRAGLTPAGSVALLNLAPPDDRPTTSARAVQTCRQILADWPVLEDEYLLAIVAGGLRLAPELIPPLLNRHRSDPVRHARVLLAAGQLGDWLIGFQPHLAARNPKPPDIDQVILVPELAISPDLQPCLTASAALAADLIGTGFFEGRLGPAHRAVLTNLIARIPPTSLPRIAGELDNVNPSMASIGIALALADLARLRYRMLCELGYSGLDHRQLGDH